MLAAILLSAGGVALVTSLFTVWSEPDRFLVLVGDLERYAGLRLTGWEVLDWADAVFAVLAAALVVLAVVAGRRRIPRAVLAVAALLCALSIATIVGHGFERRPEYVPTGVASLAPAIGPYLAIAALAAALAGLALAWLRPRPRGRAASGA